MLRLRSCLGLVQCAAAVAIGAAVAAVATGACSPAADDGHASIGLVLRAPQGLLSQATAVKLVVADAAKAPCAATGHVDTSGAGSATQAFSLERTGCAAGVAWCKQIVLDRDGSTKTFGVVASDATGILAEGCTTAAVKQDPLEVDIKVQRYLEPACCNDGKLQPGEQCDSGKASGAECKGIVADAVCDGACKAVEIPLDRQPSDAAPAPKSHFALAMAFGPGAADKGMQNGLRAAYVDTSPKSSSTDVEIRVLGEGLTSIEEPSLILREPNPVPLLCKEGQGVKGSPNEQRAPSIAPVGADVVAVAYTSDETLPTKHEVFVSAQGLDGCADDAPIQASDGPGVSDPDVAGGPTNAALVVWSRAGRIFGRRLAVASDSGGNPTLVTDGDEIAIAPSGTYARVAGSTAGWIVVYAGVGAGDGDGIFRRYVDSGGGVGEETRVNAVTDGVQDQPDVAVLGDGRHVVVWRGPGPSGSDIFFQRFDKAGVAMGKDQEAPLDTAQAGDQAHPVAAAGGQLGDFYAVAWEAGDGARIAARFVEGDEGFGFNSVTGQNDEFEASHPGTAGQRRAPAIAIGGGGYVAIGWQDESAAHPGVFVRRFPLPR